MSFHNQALGRMENSIDDRLNQLIGTTLLVTNEAFELLY